MYKAVILFLTIVIVCTSASCAFGGSTQHLQNQTGPSVLTEDHPAVAIIMKECDVDALISSELCAQLMLLQECGNLPFGLDFVLTNIERSEKEARVYYDMIIKEGKDNYSIQWIADLSETHAVLISIYKVLPDGEDCLFYAGEYTASIYHQNPRLDERLLKNESADKLSRECQINTWEAEVILGQLNVLSDSLSAEGAMFIYNPIESVTVIEKKQNSCLIQIQSYFIDVKDALFEVYTEGIVPQIRVYKGTVLSITSEKA